jgi:hypothetical protein
VTNGLGVSPFDALHGGERRRRRGDSREECFQCVGRTLEIDVDVGAKVLDEPAQIE